MQKHTKEAVEAKHLLAKARSLVAASDRMEQIALAPETDPGFMKEARRQDAADRAGYEKAMRQYAREAQLGRSKLRSDRVLHANARRKRDEADSRAYQNTLRHASNALHQHLNQDPILKSAKADAERRRAGRGSTPPPSTNGGQKNEPAAKGHSRESDQVHRRARELIANPPARY